MAKQTLPTNFQDDVLNEVNPKRKYKMIMNDDATVSFEDVTEYDQVGSNFGAAQVNETNTAVNESADKSDIIDSTADVLANTASGKMASALAVKGLSAYTPMLPLKSYSGNLNNMPTGLYLVEMSKCTNTPPYPMNMFAHVICRAGFSQTAIFYNGSNYPPVIATRTYANNAWTAWAEQAQGFDFASVRFNGLVDNALAVDLTNPYAEMNKPRYVDRAKSATNMPTDCQWGIREVCQITNNWVMVRITGWTTNSHQAIWTNVYVSSKWYGWTKFEQNVSPIRSNNVPRFYAFSQTAKTSGANSTSVLLFNDSQVNSWLGVSNSNGANTAVFISNGDGKASGVHFTGATHQSPAWYATFQTALAQAGSAVRVNGMIVYFGAQ